MNTTERRSSNAAPQKFFLPAVDVLETRDELVLVADMPGVSPESLDVTVEEGILTIIGRVGPSVGESREAIQREFLRGDYYRQFRVPREFLTDRMDASLKAGVVTIRIPREERSKPRKIPVRAE